MKYLLDTNVCIRLLNSRSPEISARLRDVGPRSVVLCSVVQAELQFGAYKSQNQAKNLALLERFFLQFESVPFDDRSVDAYGRIRAMLERQGRPIGPLDLMIAAIALAHDLTLITHNTREFSRITDLKWEDWERPS